MNRPTPTLVNWNSYAAEPIDDPLPTDGPGAPIPGDQDYDYGYLDTLMTRIDQGRCLLCGSGLHTAWQCNDFAR